MPITIDKIATKSAGKYYLKIESSNGKPGTPFNKLIVVKVEIDPCDKDWDPVAKGVMNAAGALVDETKITARAIPKNVKGKFTFTLAEVSDERGYCLNAPITVPSSGLDSDGWKDLQFKNPQPDTDFTVTGTDKETASTKAATFSEKTVTVNSFDYGAYGNIKVQFVVTSAAGEKTTIIGKVTGGTAEYATIPQDEKNGNHIRDGAAQDSGPGTDHLAIDDTDNTPAGKPGDGFTRYEEWRGVMLPAKGGGYTHTRMNTNKRELFVYDEHGLGLGLYPSTSGITVHKIDNNCWTGTGDRDSGKRRINFNAESHTIGMQHGLHLKNQKDLSFGGISCLGLSINDDPRTPPFTPTDYEWCAVDDVLLKKNIIVGGDAFYSYMKNKTIAHELGHGSNLMHSNIAGAFGFPILEGGGDQCIMRLEKIFVIPQPDGTKSWTGPNAFCDSCKGSIDVKDN